MKNLRKYFYFLLLINTATNSMAQSDLVATYQQVINQFLQQKEIAYKADYLFYESLDASQAAQQSAIRTWTTNQQYYIAFEDIEILQQNNQYVLIDHQTKAIQWQSGATAKMPNLDLKSFTHLMERYQLNGQKFLAPTGHQGIRFMATPPSRMKIELEYDADSGLIYRVAAHFDFWEGDGTNNQLDQQKIEVHFSDFQLNDIQLPVQLSQVVQITGNQIKGIGNYKDYHVLR